MDLSEARVKDSTNGRRTDPERTRGDRSTVWSDGGSADLEVQPPHSQAQGGPQGGPRGGPASGEIDSTGI